MMISDHQLWFIDRAFELILTIAFFYVFKHLFHINNSWLLGFLAVSSSFLIAGVVYKQVEKTKLWAKLRSNQQ